MSDVPMLADGSGAAPLLAAGRDADVYDLGDGTVLRRFRTGMDVGAEAALMQRLTEAGLPIPGVVDADGGDLRMARVDGPTMLEDLSRRPWMLVSHARLLARLQAEINATPAPEGLRPADPAADRTDHRVLLLDLHPLNVILSPEGPIVIDWTNALAGPASLDAALSWLAMSVADVDSTRDRIGQRILVRAFAKARDEELVDAGLEAAAAQRLADPNTTDVERKRITRIVDVRQNSR